MARPSAKSKISPIRVNVGGERYKDTLGHIWAADRAYHAGAWGCLDMATTDTLTTSDTISRTSDDRLYQCVRVGEELRYRFDVPNGTYRVRLLLCEIYWESSDAERQDVFIQDKKVVTNFSMFDEVGHDTAMEKQFTAQVSSGHLDIRFVGLSLPMHSGARVCAIEVEPATA